MRDLSQRSCGTAAKFFFICAHLSYQSEHETRHATSLLSSRVKHGMTALQQRLVVSGKRLVLPLAVRMVFSARMVIPHLMLSSRT